MYPFSRTADKGHTAHHYVEMLVRILRRLVRTDVMQVSVCRILRSAARLSVTGCTLVCKVMHNEPQTLFLDNLTRSVDHVALL